MNRKRIMIHLLLKKDGISRAKYLKSKDIFYSMGEHCYWQPYKIPSEPYLLNLHNNVIVTSNVTFVTHDIIDWMLNYKQPDKKGLEQYIGPIEIFDNVFIGNNSTILYNTKIGPNAIVAAGSVVVKDVPEGAIVGGNPAKVIGTINDFIKRRTRRQYPSKKGGIENIIQFYWGGGTKTQIIVSYWTHKEWAHNEAMYNVSCRVYIRNKIYDLQNVYVS